MGPWERGKVEEIHGVLVTKDRIKKLAGPGMTVFISKKKKTFYALRYSELCQQYLPPFLFSFFFS